MTTLLSRPRMRTEVTMNRFFSRVAQFTRHLIAPAVLAAGCALPLVADATPVLSASSANSTYAFDISAVHELAIGAFTDVYKFRLDSDVSLRSTSLYFSSDITNFVAELHAPSGRIATGISILAGAPQDEAYVNSILISSLAGNTDYEIRISGIDQWGDFGSPYSLSLRVGPVLFHQLTATSVPEPPTFLLLAAALLAITRRNGLTGTSRKDVGAR